MIWHVEEHGPGTEANRSKHQLLSAGPISGDKWPDLIGAVTLASHHESDVGNESVRSGAGEQIADQKRPIGAESQSILHNQVFDVW
jgi:hypothetical protein